ncbi:MAG: M15 family metallopeptidase [Actinomycetes bacterium]
MLRLSVRPGGRTMFGTGLVLVTAAVLGGCSRADSPALVAPSAVPSQSAAATHPPVPASKAPVRHTVKHAASLPAFASSVQRVTAADLPHSWRSGCPVGPGQLRAVQLTYYGFDGRAHRGTLVVNGAVTGPVRSVFAELYADRFPIRRMQPVDAYRGDDNASMAADNTSAFNCRAAVAAGPRTWSMHAYGEAIDVNTVENPYIFNGSVLPPNGAAYTNRSDERRGMATRTGTLVRVFKAHGWGWGGDFPGGKDYQHFSTNGK